MTKFPDKNSSVVVARKKIVCKVAGLVAVISLLAMSVEHQSGAQTGDNLTGPSVKVESFESVIAAVEANRQKNTNILLRSITVTATDPNTWVLDEKVSPSLLVNGKDVKILRSLDLLLEGKLYADENETSVLPTLTLTKHQKYWKNEAKGIRNFSIEHQEFLSEDGKVGLLNGDIPTHYVANDAIIPFLAAGKTQIAIDRKNVSNLANLPLRITGHEMFRGLDCLRLEYKSSAKNPYSGYVLVCPSRDYKLLKEEHTIVYQDPKADFRSAVDRSTVEKLQKIGSSWIPSQVHHEWIRTTIDGQKKQLTEKFRLLSFETDVINTDLLFEPQLSPGTREMLQDSNEAGSIREIVGGDISTLTARIQKGDMSFLNPEETDLSKP